MKTNKTLWAFLVVGLLAAAPGNLHRKGTQFCETCHTSHAAGGGQLLVVQPLPQVLLRDSRLIPDTASLLCLSCHGLPTDPAQAPPPSQLLTLDLTDDHAMGMDYRRSVLGVSGYARLVDLPLPEGKVGCTTCHDPHARDGAQTLQAEDPALCRTCHTLYVDFGHTPLTCSSCHAVHGGWGEASLRSAPDFLCTRCHLPSTDVHQDPEIGMACLRCHAPHRPGKPEGRRTP